MLKCESQPLGSLIGPIFFDSIIELYTVFSFYLNPKGGM